MRITHDEKVAVTLVECDVQDIPRHRQGWDGAARLPMFKIGGREREAKSMKVAVTSTGPGMESIVDERFGRARYFLVVDLDTEDVVTIDNEANVEAMQGAGIQAAQEVVRQGARWILTGHVGPKAFQALSTAGISIGTGAQGTVRETVDRFKAGGFTPADTADVQGGTKWG
jgi:predicted Fe-Mo cluster-binding NifX family protein